jgi:large subunit ribosomal protein L17
MRHKIKNGKLNMASGHRIAVIRNLAISLIKSGRIVTTLPKAKVLKSFVEPIVTIAKSNDINSKRSILSKLNTGADVSVINLVIDIAKRFINTNGGYTRIVKIGNRYGDCAKVAVVEFTDFQDKKITQASK